MDEISTAEFLEIINKRKLVIFSITLTLVLLVIIYALSVDPIYQSTVKILIGREKPKAVKFDDTISHDPNFNEYLNTQIGLLKSRSLARDVIQKLNLESKKEFKVNPSRFDWKVARKWFRSLSASPGASALSEETQTSNDPYTPIINNFLDRLTIEPVTDSQIVYIRFEGRSPQLITNITNNLVETFITKNIESQTSIESDTENWLKTRVKELQEKIRASEKILQNYKDKKNSIDFGEKRDFAADNLNLLVKERLQVQSERLRLEAQLKELENLRKIKNDPIKTFLALPLQDNTNLLELRNTYLELRSEFNSSLKNKTPQHPDTIALLQKLNDLKNRIPSEVDVFFNSLRINYKSSMAREKSLDRSLKKQKFDVMKLDKASIEFTNLKQEVDSDKNMYQVLSERLKELNLSSNFNEVNIRIIDRAEVPFKPIKPNVNLFLFLAMSLGLFSSVPIIFLMESRDKIIKNEEDIEKNFPNTYLGALRLIKKKGLKLAGGKFNSKRVEEIREVLFSFLSRILTKSNKIILVTSPTHQEGKTTIISDLSISLAQMGKKVAVLDADFSNPKIHKTFRVPNTPGLFEGLSDPAQIKSIFHNTQYNRVWVVPVGEPDMSSYISFDVLLSKHFQPFLNKLKKVMDVVLIKAPPVLSALEASIIEKYCDGILFVIESERHKDQVISQAIKKLTSSSIDLENQSSNRNKELRNESPASPFSKKQKPLGIILNKVKFKSREHYKKGYQHANGNGNVSGDSNHSFWDKWHIAGILMAVFVVIFSLTPSFPLQNEFFASPLGDFLVHSTGYGLLMFCLCQIWHQHKHQLAAGMALVSIGCLLEYFQTFIDGRNFNFLDIGANITGISVAYIVSYIFKRFLSKPRSKVEIHDYFSQEVPEIDKTATRMFQKQRL